MAAYEANSVDYTGSKVRREPTSDLETRIYGSSLTKASSKPDFKSNDPHIISRNDFRATANFKSHHTVSTTYSFGPSHHTENVVTLGHPTIYSDEIESSPTKKIFLLISKRYQYLAKITEHQLCKDPRCFDIGGSKFVEDGTNLNHGNDSGFEKNQDHGERKTGFAEGKSLFSQSENSDIIEEKICEHVAKRLGCNFLVEFSPGSGEFSAKFSNTCDFVLCLEPNPHQAPEQAHIIPSARNNIDLIFSKYEDLDKGIKADVVFLNIRMTQEEFSKNVKAFGRALESAIVMYRNSIGILFPGDFEIDEMIEIMNEAMRCLKTRERGKWKHLHRCGFEIETIKVGEKDKRIFLIFGDKSKISDQEEKAFISSLFKFEGATREDLLVITQLLVVLEMRLSRIKILKMCHQIRERLIKSSHELTNFTTEMTLELQRMILKKNIFSIDELGSFLQRLMSDDAYSPTNDPPRSSSVLNALAGSLSETKILNTGSGKRLSSEKLMSHRRDFSEHDVSNVESKSKEDLHGLSKSVTSEEFIYSEYGNGKWEDEDSESNIVQERAHRHVQVKRFHRFISEGDKIRLEDYLHSIEAKSSFDMAYESSHHDNQLPK